MNYWKAFTLLGILSTSLLVTKPAKAQEFNQVPGHLMIDFGFNFLENNPSKIKNLPFRSASWSISYLYPFTLDKGKHFSFNVGVGLSQDWYGFSNNVLPLYDTASINPTNDLIFENITDVLPANEVVKSQMMIRYINVPLEFRWEANPNHRARNLWIALGGSIGYRIGAHHEVRYSQGTETKTLIRREDFQLNQLRYGAHARVGIAWFSVYGRYEVTPVWTPKRGPNGNSWQVGISVDLF